MLIKVIRDTINNNPNFSKEEIKNEIEKMNPNTKDDQYFCDYYDDLYETAFLKYKIKQIITDDNNEDNAYNISNAINIIQDYPRPEAKSVTIER